MLRRTTALLAALALPSPLVAQDAVCLLREGSAIAPGVSVTAISNTAVNQLGGFAATVTCNDNTHRIWGNAGLGSGAVILEEATYGLLEQTSFESFFGIDDAGRPCYGPTVTDLGTATSGLDSVWLGPMVLAQEGEPIPSLPGKSWRFASRPGVTGNGIPYWVGGIDDTLSGANEGNGLFVGTDASVVYKAGDLLPGAPAVLDTSPVDFDVRFSALGNHHISGLLLDTSSSNDFIVAVDGAPLTVGGSLVREGTAIPAGVGAGPGESWQAFDFLGITEQGSTLITGDTDGPLATDEFVMVDGVIRYREGDVVDGRTLTGSIEGAYMNENGEVAYVWDVVDGGSDLEALFLEDRLLLAEGDPVDMDGDGAIDPGSSVTNFTGITSLTYGPDRTLYVTADVDIAGTSSTADDLECLLAVRDTTTPDFVASPPQISVSAGGTQAMFLDASAFAGEVYWVLGTLSGTSPGLPVGSVVVPLNFDFYFQITLSSPNADPLVDTLGTLNGQGRAVAQFSLTAGSAPVLAGLTPTHAFVVVDVGAGTVEYASVPAGLSIGG